MRRQEKAGSASRGPWEASRCERHLPGEPFLHVPALVSTRASYRHIASLPAAQCFKSTGDTASTSMLKGGPQAGIGEHQLPEKRQEHQANMKSRDPGSPTGRCEKMKQRMLKISTLEGPCEGAAATLQHPKGLSAPPGPPCDRGFPVAGRSRGA